MNNNRRKKAVEKYYDEWTHRYISSGYGDIIQAHRPTDVNELMHYICSSAGVRDGMKILDAGCGICGPAVFIAKNFDVTITAVTNSNEQVRLSVDNIERNSLGDKIRILKADYHHLDEYFEKEQFDMVIMLESFGHAVNQKEVLSGVDHVLKKEGWLYIKDYFMKEITGTKERRAGLKKAIKNMNRIYAYNLPDLNQTIKTLRKLDLNLHTIKKTNVPLNNAQSVIAFEKQFNIDIFEGGFHYLFLEPLELLFKKPEQLDMILT